jgi:hypothetical protein
MRPKPATSGTPASAFAAKTSASDTRRFPFWSSSAALTSFCGAMSVPRWRTDLGHPRRHAVLGAVTTPLPPWHDLPVASLG